MVLRLSVSMASVGRRSSHAKTYALLAKSLSLPIPPNGQRECVGIASDTRTLPPFRLSTDVCQTTRHEEVEDEVEIHPTVGKGPK